MHYYSHQIRQDFYMYVYVLKSFFVSTYIAILPMGIYEIQLLPKGFVGLNQSFNLIYPHRQCDH